jgi:hypothetical protein
MNNCVALTIASISSLLSLNCATAALYSGNNQPPDGAVSGGSLQLTDNGTSVSATFTRGSGWFAENLVLFIDSVAGGFSSTSGFRDTLNPITCNISGISSDGSSRALATFASGFAADYAIVVGYQNPNGGLYQLANGGSESLNKLGNVVLTPGDSQTSSSYTFSFNLGDIGLPSGSGNYFKFESTYVNVTGSRTLQSFESLSGTGSANGNWNPVTFGNYSTYGVDPVPEMSNVALMIFGGMAVTGGLYARLRRRSAIAS